jgi:hypothetical protein
MDLTPHLAAILQGLTIALIGGVFKVLLQMRDHLGRLNGRVAKNEATQELLAGMCTERHENLKSEQRTLWSAIRRDHLEGHS